MATISLGALIVLLESADQDKQLSSSLGDFVSYRQEPHSLAVWSGNAGTVAESLANARACVGKTFKGYKDGHYVMGLHTDVHFSFYGSMDDYPDLMLSFIQSVFHDPVKHAFVQAEPEIPVDDSDDY